MEVLKVKKISHGQGLLGGVLIGSVGTCFIGIAALPIGISIGLLLSFIGENKDDKK